MPDAPTMTMSYTATATGETVTTPPFTADDLRQAARLKPDPEFDAARDNAYSVTAAELHAFIERFERLAAEKADIADQQKDVMAEAKWRGYDTRVMRKVIALRKRDKDDIAEEQAVLQLYLEALGMT